MLFGGEHIYWWQDIKKLLGGNVKFEFIQPNSGSKYIKEEAPKYSIAGEWGSGNPGGYDGADGQVPLDTHRGSQQIFFLYNYEEPKVSPSKKGDLYYFKNLRQVDTGDSIPWGKKHMIRNSFPDISDYEFIMMCKEELLKNKDELKGMEIYYTPSPLKLLHKAVFYSDISNIVTHKTHLSLHGSFGIGFTYFNNIYPTIDLYTLDYFLDDVYNNQKLSDEDKKAILASKEQFDNTPRQTYSRQKGIKYDGKSTSKNQLKEIISSVESLLKALKSD